MRQTVTLIASLAFGLVLAACGGNNPLELSDSVDVNTTLARVERLIGQGPLRPTDAEYILTLTPEQIDTIFAARLSSYSSDSAGTLAHEESGTKQLFAEGTALAAATERIEVQMPFQTAAWWPTSWAHSNAICGGDNQEHIFLYMNVPGAYAERSRLKIFSFNAGVLLALRYYQIRQGALDSRVYTSNNIYVCVGSALHIFLGNNNSSHETWRNSCVIWKS